jgi:hypothetical protein
MKNGKMRYNAMLLALCMVLTAFVAVVSLPVGAHQISNNGDFEISWIDGWMEDDPDLAGIDEDIAFNYDDNANSLYYLGDQSAEIMLTMYNDGTNDFYDLYITLSANNPAIITGVPDNRWPQTGDYGDIPPGPVFSPAERIDTDPAGGGTLPIFTIDIATTGAVNTLYVDALEIQISYVEDVGGGTPRTDTFLFDIYISSVFDDDSPSSQIDIHDDLPDIDETDSDDEFEAGVTMQEGEFTVRNEAGFSISDVIGTISNLDPDITASGNFFDSVNPGPIGAGNQFDLYWRFDIASGADPGPYAPDLAFEYVRDDTGETINELARPTEMTVDFTPRLSASLVDDVEINQNDLGAELEVIFTNDGNVQLNDVMIMVDPDGDWIDIAFHHYENDDDVYESQVALGNIPIGSSSAAQDVMIATNMMLPNGSHRVPFAWSAWIYEDGSTGSASRWVMMGGVMYNDDGNSQTPEVERLYEDNNENRRYDGGDSTLESAWDGAFVDFNVDDNNGLTWEAVIWDTVEAGVGGDVRFTTLEVTLYNMELVDYKDLVVEMDVGPTTPFLNPIVTMHDSTTPIMMDANSDTEIDAQDSATIYFTVDVNSAWWQDSSLDPETYTVALTVDATNDDEETRIEDVNLPAVVNIDGFGPELFASLVSDDGIKPGERFMLSITITNYGDDIAREVDAYLRADFVSGWRIVDDFTSSISSYGEETTSMSGMGFSADSYNWSRGNNIRPGEIGVDNVPQIVELHDWITRRETPPQGIILWLHLDRLDVGETHTFTFEMVTDVNMVEGMVYYEVLELYYVDSNGETYGPNGAPVGTVEDNYAPPQEVLIRSGKGEKFDADAVDFSVVLYAIIFLIIAFIVFLIGYALGGRGGGRQREEEPAPFEDYEQEYVPPPEEDMPPDEPEDELGPPPVPEEDIKPPE